jgi:RNA polymerase sigma-70 factor (ECF subfamily)
MGVMASSLEIRLESSLLAEEFNRWMVSEQRRVFLLCYRMLQDRDEADTATQDAFLKAYKALTQSSAPALDDPSKWLTRIAINTCLDRLRSRAWKFWKSRPKPEDEDVILNLARAKGPDAEDQMFAREIDRRLQEAIEKLSPKQRAVFTLKHFEDRQLQEIAEILGLELGTVKAHMARALAKLRNLLEDLYIESETRRRAHGGVT